MRINTLLIITQSLKSDSLEYNLKRILMRNLIHIVRRILMRNQIRIGPCPILIKQKLARLMS